MSPPMANLCCHGWIAEHFHFCRQHQLLDSFVSFCTASHISRQGDPDLGGHLGKPKAFYGFQESHGRSKGFSKQRVSRTDRQQTEPVIYATTVLQKLRRCQWVQWLITHPGPALNVEDVYHDLPSPSPVFCEWDSVISRS